MANALDAFLNHMATGGLGAELHRGAQLADFAKRRKLREQEMAMKVSQFDAMLPIQQQNAGSRAQLAQTGAGKLALDTRSYNEAPDRLQQATDIRVAGEGRKHAIGLTKDQTALGQVRRNDEQLNHRGAPLSSMHLTAPSLIDSQQNERVNTQGYNNEYSKGKGRGDALIEARARLKELGLLPGGQNSPEAMALKAIIAAELENQKAQGRNIVNPNVIANAQGPVGPRLDTVRDATQTRIGGLKPKKAQPYSVQELLQLEGGGAGPAMQMSPAQAIEEAKRRVPGITGPDLAALARRIAAGQE